MGCSDSGSQRGNPLIRKSASAWIRTKDQLIKSQLLYRLSYRGIT